MRWRPHDVSVDAAVPEPRERSEPRPLDGVDLGQGTLRVNTSKGQVDRVVYLSPDVATALRQWHGLQSTTADYVFPSPMPRKGGLPLGARQIRNRMTLSEAGDHQALCASLRHTFATQLLNAGASLEVVKTHGAPLAPDDPPLYPAL